MPEGREPLSARSLNCSLTSVASASTRPPSSPSLYPIFLGKRVAVSESPSTPASDPGRYHDEENDNESEHKWKGIKSSPTELRRTDKRPRLSNSFSIADDTDHQSTRAVDRLGGMGINNFFPPAVPRRAAPKPKPQVYEYDAPVAASAWRRPRSRLGFPAPQPNISRRAPYLPTLTFPGTSTQTSTLAIPSIYGNYSDRDFDPALVLAFNSRAKLYTADEARQAGETRLLALGGEEGSVKIVNVDNAEDAGVLWRAHPNALFDLKWTLNDTRLVSASADQTLRIHDVTTSEPQVLAALRGHTSTIKAVAVLDPSQGGEPSGNILASGGRDGNINIYDLRCPGTRQDSDASLRRSSRIQAPASGLGGVVDPVMVLKQPHNAAPARRVDSRSVTRTITSLTALECMPGILASGGTYDGVVKLWDIRCPEPTSSLRPKFVPYGSLPDPTTFGPNASLRGRSVNALCEQPTNGDLYALCGDSKIHVLRPAAAKQAMADPADAILPQKFVHSDLLINAFYIRMSLSPDSKYLACGSQSGGVMAWDTSVASPEVVATRLRIPSLGPNVDDMPDVVAVDWAKDMVAASSDDCVTRLWRAPSSA